MAQLASVPFAQSPLSPDFQHMDTNDFAQICQAYNQLWVQEGIFPQVELPAPGPFKGFVPKMYICTSWSPIGKVLLQEGSANETERRDLLLLVPKGTTNTFSQFVMTAGNGALSKFLIRLGASYQYPRFAKLETEYSSFIPAGPRHDTLREIYASSASAEKMRTCNYQEKLAEGAEHYLEDLRTSHLAEGSFSTDIALTIGRGTASAAIANLFGLPVELLNQLVNLSRFMDQTLSLRPSHQQFQEADSAVAQACNLLEEAIKNEALSPEGVLAREYKRLVTNGSYTLEQWAYIAIMLFRVSIENQMDAVNLNCRRFASLLEEEKRVFREKGSVELFTQETMRIDPPIGFILRKLVKAYTFDTPVAGKKLHLPAGSFVLFVPRLLQSSLLDDNCGDYLLTFGHGRDKVCPGRLQGLLTVTVCCREIFKRFDLEYSGQQLTADNAFFRRIVTAPGKVTIL